MGYMHMSSHVVTQTALLQTGRLWMAGGGFACQFFLLELFFNYHTACFCWSQRIWESSDVIAEADYTGFRKRGVRV